MEIRLTYKELINNHLYGRLLKETERFEGKFKETNGCMAAFYYRIRAFIILGQFDDALRLCKEVIEGLDEDHLFLNNINYFLSCIYFYTGDYKKSLEYHSCCDKDHDSRPRDFMSIISAMAARDPKVHDEVYNRDRDHLKKHLEDNHDDDLHIDKDLLIKLVMDNFDYARTYYDNYSMYKIFQIDFVGSTEVDGKEVPCNYVKVIFKEKDNPNSIATMYAMHDIGELDSTDLTRQYSVLSNPVKKPGGTSPALTRFKKRQALKK